MALPLSYHGAPESFLNVTFKANRTSGENRLERFLAPNRGAMPAIQGDRRRPAPAAGHTTPTAHGGLTPRVLLVSVFKEQGPPN